MIEKLFIIFIVIEAMSVAHNITKSIIDILETRSLAKSQQNALEGQQNALEGQQKAIKIQEEQLELSKFYSEKQDEQNKNIKHLAWLIAAQDERLKEVEKRLAKRATKNNLKSNNKTV